jgi:tetratricopeptide (TPR) repeat protein
MARWFAFILSLWFGASVAAAGTTAPGELKDLFFGEALYDAFQEKWFDAIARLDTELTLYRGLDEPQLDTLHAHFDHAEFAVGDFELAYRMHHRAGRAIKAVIEGNVDESTRNEAIYRLARLYFQKDQPLNALFAMERIMGEIPPEIRDDVEFLRGQIFMVNGRFAEAAEIFRELQEVNRLQGFSTYNLGIALLRNGSQTEGRHYLDRAGRIGGSHDLTLAIRDKSNLVLGSKLMQQNHFEEAKQILDRVRLSGPFSNRALLGSGWADASRDLFQSALAPWTLLMTREVTDASVQEAMLAVAYAYGKLKVYSKAALMYGRALEKFNAEVDKLDASIKSIRQGHFLKALVREELNQDANWVVKLRQLPQTPETYYLLALMASHDFQASLKNYLDLEQLRRKLEAWKGDLDAFEQIIEIRRAYYRPLLPAIDRQFRQLDSQMRLRLEQRERIRKRLNAMLVAPRPDVLATSKERMAAQRIGALERRLSAMPASSGLAIKDRIRRLQGVLKWNILTQYDRRFTEAHHNLRDLNQAVDRLEKQYAAFIRTRQAATQSYEGYGDTIRRLRHLIRKGGETVEVLMARQGNQLETMAVAELTRRRERLSEYQIKARFAMADSYDRATRTQTRERVEQ